MGTLSGVRDIFDKWLQDIDGSGSTLFGMGWDNDCSEGDGCT